MIRRVLAIVLIVLCVSSPTGIEAWPVHGNANTVIRIMPLGDSITQGLNTSYGSYRRLLYSLLIANGVNVEFVGDLSDGTFPSPMHEGLTGYYIDGIRGQVTFNSIIERNNPSIILLLIGTNDIWHGPTDTPTETPSDALTLLGLLLSGDITTHGPNVKVIVASIPPIASFVAGPTVSSNVNVYNAGIPAAVAAAGANFSFVDVNAALTTSDLVDGVHPTDAGNDKIAPVWLAGILAVLLGNCGGGGLLVTSSTDCSNVLQSGGGDNLTPN